MFTIEAGRLENICCLWFFWLLRKKMQPETQFPLTPTASSSICYTVTCGLKRFCFIMLFHWHRLFSSWCRSSWHQEFCSYSRVYNCLLCMSPRFTRKWATQRCCRNVVATNLEGPKKLNTAEKADFSAQNVSVHRKCPFCMLVTGHSWAKNESWKTYSRSRGLVSCKNHGNHSAHLSLACVPHNRASAVTAHGLILAGWFNIYWVPIKFIGWQLVAPVVIYKQQQHNTDIRKSKRNSMPLCNIQH